MNVREAIFARRTIRRFQQKPLPCETLQQLVDAARLAPSGGNVQPWMFVVVDDASLVEQVFPLTAWAGYIAPRGIPPEGERPVAYIVVLQAMREKAFTPKADLSAAIQNILLAAMEEGIGTCWIGSVQREKLAVLLSVPEGYEIDSIVALGYPNEAPVVEEFKGSIAYWKDEKNVLHVPKKGRGEVLRRNRFET